MDEKIREKLIHAESPEEVLNIIDEADDEATKEEEAEANENATVSTDNSNQDNNEPYVLAVTACPTGIAHTGSVAKLKLYAHLYKTIKANIVLTVKSFVSINYFRFSV